MLKYPQISSINSVTVINPASGDVLTDSDITIENGEITAIEPSKRSNGEGLEGSGLFAIPGLIDTHVHAMGFMHEKIPGLLDLRWAMRQQRRNLAQFLRGGVTTIRDMAAPLKMVRKMSQRAAKFEVESPRFLYAGPMFTAPGGYPYFAPKVPFLLKLYTGPLRFNLKMPDGEVQARKAVDRVASAGAHCIKIGYQTAKYDDERTEIPSIPISLIKVIVERAHHHGLPAAVHHVYRKDLQDLLVTDIPYDSQEHLTIDEPLSNSEVQQFAQRKIPISTTLMTYGIIDHVERMESLLEQESDRFEKKPTEFLHHCCEALRSGETPSRFIGWGCIKTGSKIMRENLKKLVDAGVTIAYGTDSGGAMTPPGCPHWELIDMIRAGMTPLEALRSATSVAADVVGIPKLGRLEEGAIADIVLLRDNPLKNIEAVGEVGAVIREGYLVHDNLKKGG